MEKGLGTDPVVSLLKILWGWKAIIPHVLNLTEGHITTGVGR